MSIVIITYRAVSLPHPGDQQQHQKHELCKYALDKYRLNPVSSVVEKQNFKEKTMAADVEIGPSEMRDDCGILILGTETKKAAGIAGRKLKIRWRD